VPKENVHFGLRPSDYPGVVDKMRLLRPQVSTSIDGERISRIDRKFRLA
jgi:hypothetical protein